VFCHLISAIAEGRDRTACSSTERHEAPPSSQPTTGGDWTLLLHEGKKFEDAHAKDGSLPDPASTDNAEFKCVLLTRRSNDDHYAADDDHCAADDDHCAADDDNCGAHHVNVGGHSLLKRLCFYSISKQNGLSRSKKAP